MDYVHRVGGALRLFLIGPEMAPLTVNDRAVYIVVVLRKETRTMFDITCLNEQSRNNDGHEGSSDGVLSDYPTVYCGIL